MADCRWCNAPKKNPESAFGFLDAGTASRNPKALSGFFLFLCYRVYKRVNSVKVASIYADSLSKPRVYIQVICQKRVYSIVYSCGWRFYTRAFTRMSLAAMIHALLHGPDTFFPKSFCAARSAGMSPIPCSDIPSIRKLQSME